MCCFGFTKLLYTHTCLPLVVHLYVVPTQAASTGSGHVSCARTPVHARMHAAGQVAASLAARYNPEALLGSVVLSPLARSRLVRAPVPDRDRAEPLLSFLAAPPSSRPSAYHQHRPTLSSSSSNPSARPQSTHTLSPATRPPPLSAFTRWQKQGWPWMQGAAKHRRRHFLQPFQPPEWNPRWARITPHPFLAKNGLPLAGFRRSASLAATRGYIARSEIFSGACL
jgi:hypothetical protein